jgi:hypothetical protein
MASVLIEGVSVSPTMIPIEYSKRTICSYKDYGCREVSCPLNIGHKAVEPYFTVLDIPRDKCLYTFDVIADESIDNVIRAWMKEAIVEKKRVPIPREVCEFIKRKSSQFQRPQ